MSRGSWRTVLLRSSRNRNPVVLLHQRFKVHGRGACLWRGSLGSMPCRWRTCLRRRRRTCCQRWLCSRQSQWSWSRHRRRTSSHGSRYFQLGPFGKDPLEHRALDFRLLGRVDNFGQRDALVGGHFRSLSRPRNRWLRLKVFHWPRQSCVTALKHLGLPRPTALSSRISCSWYCKSSLLGHFGLRSEVSNVGRERLALHESWLLWRNSRLRSFEVWSKAGSGWCIGGTASEFKLSLEQFVQLKEWRLQRLLGHLKLPRFDFHWTGIRTRAHGLTDWEKTWLVFELLLKTWFRFIDWY